MRFGFETVIWGRRIDDLELVLDTIAACGYEGVEFAQSPYELYLLDPAASSGKRVVADISELLQLLASRGLTLIGLAGGALEERMEFCGDFRQCFLYVEDLGDSEWKALENEKPFQLGLHPHWFMKVQRLNQARKRLFEYRSRHPDRNNLLLLPDTAPLDNADDDPVLAVNDTSSIVSQLFT